MQLSPIERYQQDLNQAGFQSDTAQMMAVEKLQVLYETLSFQWQQEQSMSVFRRLLNRVVPSKALAPQGLYFWGGVGRGKTYLMDLFYDALPFEQKMRTHFHRFMRRIHGELKLMSDQADPLLKVAEILAGEARVICFDEFFVSDITDAMILAGLLDALFARGVVLVTTSNIVPDGLYRDGLQRARFLPAIDLLNKQMDVVNVDGGVDYRLRTLEQMDLYCSPLSLDAEASLGQYFTQLVPDLQNVRENEALEVEGRRILAKKVGDDVVWFEFSILCDGPRSQNDYIVLACEYHAVIVEGVPVLGGSNDDVAKRFIYLVDEFYDRNVKLIISAEVDLLSLYQGGRAEFEFQRTISRLREMQSSEYLARPHKP